MDILLNRRSVRLFNDEEVTDSELDYLIKVGFSAPSARNQNSRQFIIIDDKNIIEELSNISSGAKVLKNANKVIGVIGYNDGTLLSPDFIEADLAAATENILLAATNINLGSCWIGVSPVKDRVLAAGKILNVNDNQYVYSLIAIGHLKSDFKFSYKDKYIKEYVYRNKVK